MSQESNPFPTADRTAIERTILNEMHPVSVSRVGKNWKIGGLHFESVLKNRASDHEPWSYIENGKKIGLACKEMRWSNGTVIKTGVNASIGVIDTESSPVSLTYPDALGAGINVKIIQDNYRWQKIIEIESLASLGEIPGDAEYLEISFKVSGDFALPDGAIEDRISIGDNSFIELVRAWNSSSSGGKSGAVGVIEGNVLTKRIPVAWLQSASYPVQADMTIAFGSGSVFNAAATLDVSVARIDATHFIVAYRDQGNSEYGTARIGTISGATISYGAASVFSAHGTQMPLVGILDSTHFVIAYSGSGYGDAIIGVFSGDTITSYGAENTFNTGSYAISMSVLDSTHFVVAYEDDYSYAGTAIVGEVSGDTISFGAKSVYNALRTHCNAVLALSSTKFVVAYYDVGGTHYGHARIGEVAGTTISFGAISTFKERGIIDINLAKFDSTHFVIVYFCLFPIFENGARIGIVEGTTITYGDTNDYYANGGYCVVAVLDDSNFVLTYFENASSPYRRYAMPGTISGTTITYGDSITYGEGACDYYRTGIAALDDTHLVIVNPDGANSNHGTAIIGELVAGVTFVPQIIII